MTKLSNSKPTAVREKTSEPKKKTMGKSQTNLARKKSNARFDGGHLLPSKVIISSPSVYTLIRPDQSITDIGHGDLPFQGDTAMGPDAQRVPFLDSDKKAPHSPGILNPNFQSHDRKQRALVYTSPVDFSPTMQGISPILHNNTRQYLRNTAINSPVIQKPESKIQADSSRTGIAQEITPSHTHNINDSPYPHPNSTRVFNSNITQPANQTWTSFGSGPSQMPSYGSFGVPNETPGGGFFGRAQPQTEPQLSQHFMNKNLDNESIRLSDGVKSNGHSIFKPNLNLLESEDGHEQSPGGVGTSLLDSSPSTSFLTHIQGLKSSSSGSDGISGAVQDGKNLGTGQTGGRFANPDANYKWEVRFGKG